MNAVFQRHKTVIDDKKQSFPSRDTEGIELPEKGSYGTGIFFISKSYEDAAQQQFEALAAECNIKVGSCHSFVLTPST